MKDKLIEELRECLSGDNDYFMHLNGEAMKNRAFIPKKMIEEIISLHEHDKAVEPLAVLADRKGYDVEAGKEDGMGECADHWGILLKRWIMGEPDHREFHDYTYSAAEAKVRAYLEALPDKSDSK